MRTDDGQAMGNDSGHGAMRLSRPQALVVLIVFLLQILDGFDLLGMSFAASGIAREWQLSFSALGIVFSAALFGSLAGAVGLSALLNLFDRKHLLIVATALTGAGSLGAALAPDVTLLFAARLVTGLGLGALSPLAIGYAANFTPAAMRGTMVAIAVGSISVGSIAGSVVAAILIPLFGWPSVFYVGSIAALLMMPCLFWLPAWPQDLLRRGRPRHEIDAVCARFGIELPAETAQPARRRLRIVPLRELIDGGLLVHFVAMLAAALFGALASYFLSTWLPILIERSGQSTAQASLALGWMNGGAVVGILTLGWLMDRLTPQLVLACALTVAAPLFVLMTAIPSAPAIIIPLCTLIGFFHGAAVSSTSTASALLFPAHLRVEVLANIIAAGRIAGITAPAGAGFILAAGVGQSDLFWIAGGLAFSGALAFLASWLAASSASRGATAPA